MSLRRAVRYATLVLAVSLSGCMYSFRAGSFPPEHIRTIAIVPFENDTDRFELSAELYERLMINSHLLIHVSNRTT